MNAKLAKLAAKIAALEAEAEKLRQPKKPKPRTRLKFEAPKPVLEEAEFLGQVKNLQLQIIRDEGNDRRIKFVNPEKGWHWFEIVTWPGKLCISGDMGTFVFSRLLDMFDFFRAGPKDSKSLYINKGYWAEKCISRDRDGVKEFSAEHFRARISDWLDYHDDISEDTLDEIESEVIGHADDGERFAMQAAIDFKSEDGFRFSDFWEADCTQYTYSFIWMCYAIAWGIKQYDAAKAEATNAK